MAFYNNTDATPERPECTLLTTNLLTTIYTVASDDLTLDTATFVNTTAGSVDCSLIWRSIDTAVDATVWNAAVRSLGVDGLGNLNASFPIRLKKGDIIKAKGANNVWINLLFMKNRRNISP